MKPAPMPHYERFVKRELLFSKYHEQLEAKLALHCLSISFQNFSILELPKMFEKPTAHRLK